MVLLLCGKHVVCPQICPVIFSEALSVAAAVICCSTESICSVFFSPFISPSICHCRYGQIQRPAVPAAETPGKNRNKLRHILNRSMSTYSLLTIALHKCSFTLQRGRHERAERTSPSFRGPLRQFTEFTDSFSTNVNLRRRFCVASTFYFN